MCVLLLWHGISIAFLTISHTTNVFLLVDFGVAEYRAMISASIDLNRKVTLTIIFLLMEQQLKFIDEMFSILYSTDEFRSVECQFSDTMRCGYTVAAHSTVGLVWFEGEGEITRFVPPNSHIKTYGNSNTSAVHS